MPLVFNSQLRRHDTMDSRRIDGIIKLATDSAYRAAVSMIGEGNYVARQLHRGDLPTVSATNRTWLETTGATTDQFITAAIGNGGNINDDTVIAIYGCRWVYSETFAFAPINRMPIRPPVSHLRIIVGGTRVAEWDLLTIFTATAFKGANSSLSTATPAVLWQQPIGIAESIVLVKPRSSLTLQYNEVSSTAVDFGLQILGVVVEKTGTGDGLNP